MQYAFVIKNYIPLYHKVQLFHQELGLITCIYSKDHQASRLTTGALIVCTVEPMGSIYRCIDLDVIIVAKQRDLATLEFIHDVIRIFWKRIPSGVRLDELFDYLFYVYQSLSSISDNGKMVVFLRLFLILDLLPETPEAYRIAMHDPFAFNDINHSELKKYLHIGWDRWSHAALNKDQYRY